MFNNLKTWFCFFFKKDKEGHLRGFLGGGERGDMKVSLRPCSDLKDITITLTFK